MLLLAAKQGLRCYGYELNPVLWVISKIRTLRYHKNVTIYCRSFWGARLPKTTKGIYTFLLDPYMQRLDQKLTKELKFDTKLVSYTFQIPGKKVEKQANALFLYYY